MAHTNRNFVVAYLLLVALPVKAAASPDVSGINWSGPPYRIRPTCMAPPGMQPVQAADGPVILLRRRGLQSGPGIQ